MSLLFITSKEQIKLHFWWCLDQLNSCRRNMKTVVIEILSRQFKYAWISPLPMLDFTDFTEMLLVCFPVLEQY